MPDNPVFRHCIAANPHHLYMPPVPDKNFDAAPAVLALAPAPAPTLLYTMPTFLKRLKFKAKLSEFVLIGMVTSVNRKCRNCYSL
jgi:hypothetical protein